MRPYLKTKTTKTEEEKETEGVPVMDLRHLRGKQMVSVGHAPWRHLATTASASILKAVLEDTSSINILKPSLAEHSPKVSMVRYAFKGAFVNGPKYLGTERSASDLVHTAQAGARVLAPVPAPGTGE